MDTDDQKLSRRQFLKGTAAVGATAIAAAPGRSGAAPADAADAGKRGKKGTPASRLAAAETQPPGEGEVPADALHVAHPGSDFMVDVLRALDYEFVAACPGSTFRGLHESLVNYKASDHMKPEFIVCTHEETSAAIAHGYAKVSGKPMAVLVHSNVGLQHASMAIYNAWCDRVPMTVIAGNVLDAVKRRPGVEWYHTAQDVNVLVRDFVKWDDTPVSLPHFAESLVRAHTVSLTPPMAPVLITADADLQEAPVENPGALRIPGAREPAPPTADAAVLAEIARLLVGAERPVIVVDRTARDDAGVAALVALAESVNAPVVDLLGRMNFPTNHYLNHTWTQKALVRKADLILGLGVTDIWGVVNVLPDTIERPSKRIAAPGAKIVHVSADYLYLKSNHQDFERYLDVDLPVAADPQAVLPGLLEAVRRQTTPARRRELDGRAEKLRAAHAAMRERALGDAARDWNASPVGVARLCQEIWARIKDDDWALTSATSSPNRWPNRLWDFTRYHQFIGSQGGYGIGYGLPASIGAAIAHKQHGRLSVNIQTDGDLMMLPGALWTAVHHRVPLLTVMHNNRAWHQETMHIQRMAGRRNRNPERGWIGTRINEPFIDYAAMARSMGMWAEGPVSDPDALGPALDRALAVVRKGEPALVDVVTQPR